MPEGHKLPVPPRLYHAAPLPCLTPSASEHPVIHVPSLSRISQHSANSGVPKFPGLGSRPPAAHSCAAAHCVLAAPFPAHPCPAARSLGMRFSIQRSNVPNFVPSGLQGFGRQGAGGPGTGRDPSVPPPAWTLPEMYGRCGRPCAAGRSLFQLQLWIPHVFGITSATPLACGPACLSAAPREQGLLLPQSHRKHRGCHSPTGRLGTTPARPATMRSPGLLLGAAVPEGAQMSVSSCGTLRVPPIWGAEGDGEELQMPCTLAPHSGYHPASHRHIPVAPHPQVTPLVLH